MWGLIERIRSHYFSPGFLVILPLSVYLWHLALIGKGTIVQGDSIIIGLPFSHLRTEVIEGHASLLWARGIYGGHPLFAEGQAGFFSLLPMLVAALVTPLAGEVYSLNLFAFLCMVLTAVGVIGLCRSLTLGRWPAAFAALVVTFSPQWLGMQPISVLSGSFLWIPWCLWAMEAWLRRPSFRAGALMGAALASQIMAGYPQAFHGTVIYMAVSLVTLPLQRVQDRSLMSNMRLRLASGFVAIAVCIGLAAVQLLPLMELVPLSHRRAGIGLILQVGRFFYVRGMLFSFPWAENIAHFSKANIGSLLVCVAASLLVAFNRSPRLLGHLVAAIFLAELGCGEGSPIFNFIYEHDLIPGLKYFRVVHLYWSMAVVGIGVAAAGAIDGIARWKAVSPAEVLRSSNLWVTIGVALLWWRVLGDYATPDVPAIQYVLPIVAILGTFALLYFVKHRWIAAFVTALLFIECVALRMHYFRMIPAAMEKPESIRAIQSVADWRQYKLMDVSGAVLYAVHENPWDVDLVGDFRRMMSSGSGLTPELWGIDGLNDILALPLARRTQIDSRIRAEIAGSANAPPGSRLIDILSVRFIGLHDPVATPGFRQLWHGPDQSFIMENTAALPRFQVYDRYVSVDSPEEAEAVMRDWRERTLVIEDPAHSLARSRTGNGAGNFGDDAAPPELQVRKETDTEYQVDISAARACWLFLADADYPGWSATIDGGPTAVYAAQVLGKAVEVPPGRHQVRIAFRSATFAWGAWISAVSLLLTICLIARWPGRRWVLQLRRSPKVFAR
jgi:hypothetical protein